MISDFERTSLLIQGLQASPNFPPVKSETGCVVLVELNRKGKIEEVLEEPLPVELGPPQIA
jgi:hypothetical protein